MGKNAIAALNISSHLMDAQRLHLQQLHSNLLQHDSIPGVNRPHPHSSIRFTLGMTASKWFCELVKDGCKFAPEWRMDAFYIHVPSVKLNTKYYNSLWLPWVFLRIITQEIQTWLNSSLDDSTHEIPIGTLLKSILAPLRMEAVSRFEVALWMNPEVRH